MLSGAACGVLENPSFTSQRHIFFVRTSNWVILDSLERLRGVESIHIMIGAMGGHGTTHKLIILPSLCSLCFKMYVEP